MSSYSIHSLRNCTDGSDEENYVENVTSDGGPDVVTKGLEGREVVQEVVM